MNIVRLGRKANPVPNPLKHGIALRFRGQGESLEADSFQRRIDNDRAPITGETGIDSTKNLFEARAGVNERVSPFIIVPGALVSRSFCF